MSEVEKTTLDRNEATIRGYVVHVFKANKATLLNVSTRNYNRPGKINENGKLNYVSDYPEIVFFGEQGERIANGVKEGDFITVKANMQSSKRGENVSQSLFGESIEFTESLLESVTGIESSRNYPEDKNELILNGEITSVRTFGPKIIGMIIRTNKSGHISYVRATYYVSDAEKEMRNIPKHARVVCICRMQTTRRIKGSTVKHYENVVVQDLKVFK